MKVVFFGTPSFALPTLQALIDRPEFDVQAVISQPDRPKGRGKKLQPTPVKALARAHDIPVWQPERLKRSPEMLRALDALNADVFVVVAYGQILSPQVLAMPRLGCVNVHGSLLPAYRGAAPIQWAIANGETETGITTILMDAGMDKGDMLLKTAVPIDPNCTAPELADTLAPLGAELLVETLLKLEAGALTPEPQQEELATYAPLLQKSDFAIDWSQAAIALHNQIRAFHPNCFSDFGGQRCKILRSEAPPEGDAIGVAPPGTVLDILKNQGFSIQTGSGPLLLKQVQLSGKKAQSAWDFANGVRLQPGQQLGS
ncbi:methionyl-tRNA formyltransferase [Synechococcus sp. PCC 7336]|uniref:methionyl-tRNA formyltransferase n=1 Tax=Synechococcus sp. PCC 7336 TaxID=195250 RepID=UPI000349EF7F|nr:methionyl-tRNA formyltransferase [Synechococcus sp. PCC 7336]